MGTQVDSLTCRGCGAPLAIDAKKCPYCRGPVTVTTFTSVSSLEGPTLMKYVGSYKKDLAKDPDNQDTNLSIAFCYLKLGKYDDALAAFNKAIADDMDNPDAYFYTAVCQLKGKKAFLTPRPDINKIEENIQAAITLSPKGIYYYFWAYIKYDYFKRKFFNTSPTYQEAFAKAKQCGLSHADAINLFKDLGVACPDVLQY